MDKLIYALILLLPIAFILLFYILWINGYMVKSSKAAMLFVFKVRRKNRCKIYFKSCSGYIKRVIKISESRRFLFTFDGDITKGNVTAEVQDAGKKTLLKLDISNPESAVDLDKNKRYYLVVNFENADGEFDLVWN